MSFHHASDPCRLTRGPLRAGVAYEGNLRSLGLELCDFEQYVSINDDEIAARHTVVSKHRAERHAWTSSSRAFVPSARLGSTAPGSGPEPPRPTRALRCLPCV